MKRHRKSLETMSLREMGPQLKLPINVPTVGGYGSDIISTETSYSEGFQKELCRINCANLLPGDRDNYQSGVPAYANIPKLYHP